MGAKQLKPQPERVRRIKEEKERQGLTDQQIADIALELKEYTSRSSVRRVTTDGSETVGFRDATLRPIEKALGIHHDDEDSDSADMQIEFYQRIIRELNDQLKASRRAHLWKNVAIAFLAVLLAALLAVDRVLPEVGWYGTAGAAAWWIVAALLFAFILAVITFHFLLPVHVRVQEEQPHDDE